MIRSYDTLVASAPAASLVGRHVFTPDDETLGAIKYLVGSGFGGRIAYVVVASDAPETKMFAIPPAAFSQRAGSSDFILNIAPEQMRQVPEECPWL